VTDFPVNCDGFSVLSPLIKFCGLLRSEDAFHALSIGADLAGFIFHEASQRDVSPRQAARIESGGLVRVGVFVLQGATQITEIMEEARLDMAQFHGRQTEADALRVGPERVIKVFWPERHDDNASLAMETEPWLDLAALFLFDAGLSGGGHGRPVEGSHSGGGLDFLKSAGKPSILAGGMSPATLKALPPLDELPFLCGFDFNSGVETEPGVKDHRLMSQSAEIVRDMRLSRPIDIDVESLKSGRRGPG
jgi:phosphoribosylanthranilate isomerase